MSMEQLKQQLITIFAVRGDKDSSIFMLIYSILLLTFIDYVLQYIPVIVNFIQEYMKKKMETAIVMPTLKPTIKSRIVFTKDYAHKNDNMCDAIIQHLCEINDVKDLLYTDFFIINNEAEFPITSKISGHIVSKVRKDNAISMLSIEVYSYDLTLIELREWCENIYRNYEIEKKNKFGTKRFFFDEVLPDPTIIKRGGTVPPYIEFTMTEFNTNKQLQNIYGTHLDIVKSRMKLFLSNPDWYKRKGIPYTLGILLHGPPGTGKTSLIKAIAKDSKRHLFNLKLCEQTTQTQLRDLFFNEQIHVKHQNRCEMVTVPLEQRIYVIEDIDCLSSIVYKRVIEPPLSSEKDKDNDDYKIEDVRDVRDVKDMEVKHKRTLIEKYSGDDKNENANDKLNLSFLLNLFDGILETPGRIIVMTTNHPDRLDPALIRPGRIDLNINVDYCTCEMIKEMFEGFYEQSFDYEFSMIDKKFTPAEIQSTLCNYLEDPSKAFSNLL